MVIASISERTPAFQLLLLFSRLRSSRVKSFTVVIIDIIVLLLPFSLADVYQGFLNLNLRRLVFEILAFESIKISMMSVTIQGDVIQVEFLLN